MGRWEDALRELDSSLRLRERMARPLGIGNDPQQHRRGAPDAWRAPDRDRGVRTRDRRVSPIGYGSGVALALTGLGRPSRNRRRSRGLEVLRDAEGPLDRARQQDLPAGPVPLHRIR